MLEPQPSPQYGPLSAPLFRDERLTDTARMNYWIAAVVVFVTTGFVPFGYALIPGAMPLILPVVIAAWVNCAATLTITRFGHPVAGARSLVAGTWAITTALVAVTGGLDSPAISGLFFVIAFSAILLGWWECVVATLATVVTVLALTWAGAQGLLAYSSWALNTTLDAAVFVTICGLLAGVQIVSVRTLQRALHSSRTSAKSLRLAGAVYETTTEGIVVTLPDGEIVDVNDAYCRIHRCSRESVIGQNPRILKSDRHGPEFYKEMWDTILTTGQWQGEIWDRRADDTLLPKWLSISSVKDSSGEPVNYVGVFSDISAIKEGEATLEWLATHDPLTHLPNRALIDDRLTTVLARARRQGSTAAVLFFDIDRFKDVNDTLGHPAGDALLAEIAMRCSTIARESDSVGRIGGDEFCVVASDYSSPDDLESLARRFLAAIAEPVRLGEEDVFVTASMGIAVFPDDGQDVADLVKHADIAMYRAKSLGGNAFEFFSPGLQEEFEERVGIATGLRRALCEERLFLTYQPQVNLRTGCITGVEALVRWRAKDGSVIMPDRFISVAEESGMSSALGEWVLNRALIDLRQLLDDGIDLTMAVNFSARQFSEVDVPTQVIGMLAALEIPAEKLEVEITETALVTKMDAAIAKVDALLAAGVRVAIDDFGTGYGSMSYIQLFHPSKIKIDRSFVVGLPDDLGAKAIVRASIALASGIGASVVAEGPDTEAQVRFLQEHGCTTAQGFWFSKPVELPELIRLLAAGAFALPANDSAAFADLRSLSFGAPAQRLPRQPRSAAS